MESVEAPRHFEVDIDEVFGIRGRAASVLAGRVREGTVRVGAEAEVVHPDGTTISFIVADVLLGFHSVNEVLAGDNCGLLTDTVIEPRGATPGLIVRSRTPGRD